MDTTLHQRIIEGDGSALAEIYDSFSGLVYGLALRVTRDSSIAQEVVQETFIKLWESASSFNPEEGSLRSWLSMIAHRKSVDWIRRTEAQRQRVHTAAQQEFTRPPVTPPDEIAAANDHRRQVAYAVASLPQEQQDVLKLAYYEGLTYRQVATVLGIPEGTAKSRIRLGLQRLANVMRNLETSLEANAR